MTATLDAIQQALAKEIALASWASDYTQRAVKIERFRRYSDGDHDADMTAEMRRLLRVSGNRSDSPFNANQCDNIIQSVVDRLNVTAIQSDNEAATKWGESVLEWNRIDGLQLDVHEATLLDGDSYVLVEFDNEAQMPKLHHEPAWDGSSGMLVVHKRYDKHALAAAAKVWQTSTTSLGDTLRANLYYPDRIEKYISRDGGELQRYVDDADNAVWPLPWVDASGQALGVPVVQFRNRTQGGNGYGKSELEDAIPLQDALNRTLFSMVMVAELSGFPIRWSKGFAPPAGVTPGMWIKIAEAGMSKDDVAELGSLEQGQITPFIEQARFLIEQIEAVTRTPRMNMGTEMSGEALKQMEIKLLGKVRRFQIKAGNSWEDVMRLAARITAAFGTATPPEATRWQAKWANAALRNDTETVGNAVKVADKVGLKRFLQLIAPVYEFSQQDIADILSEVQGEQAARVNAALTSFNPF